MRTLEVVSRGAPSNWLAQYKKKVTSQAGEDGVIEKIFQILPASAERWCVEFGAGDGQLVSNTWSLLNQGGWHGVLIEAGREPFAKLGERYRDKPRVTCLQRMVDFTGPDSLDQILAQTAIAKDFDLLSIDIDGNDYHIWESLNLYRPRVVLIEYNPTIPADVRFIQDQHMGVNQGSSLLALAGLGKQKGYQLVATTELNAFFVREADFPLFDIKDNQVSVMYDENVHGTKIFQLYDGTWALAGCRKMLWHEKSELNEEKIQVLPPHRRGFAGFLPAEPRAASWLQRLRSVFARR